MKDASSKAVEARKAKTVEAYKESLDKLTGEAEKLEVFLRESLYHDSPLSVVRDNFRKVGRVPLLSSTASRRPCKAPARFTRTHPDALPSVPSRSRFLCR